ncbi:uncharacterized protein LOC141902143 [Tubulanus polymorphus]|uniref:uncharacterized protein LOC141902143 n=1 Tax=Tubulanus polymorphus TaxID=672921 RepID=UPI003DA455BF
MPMKRSDYKPSCNISNDLQPLIDMIDPCPQYVIKLEHETRMQRDSSLWFNERQYRLTASNFGLVLNRKAAPTEKFLSSLITKKDLSSIAAIQYGIDNEPFALSKYRNYMANSGKHVDVLPCGLAMNRSFSWLGATPDGKIIVADTQSYGLLEIKCPYSFKDVTHGKIQLKTSHHYYSQIQGQMGVCGLDFRDFVIYTKKGMSIQRIPFHQQFWDEMLDKISIFYLTHLAPYIVKNRFDANDA